MTEMTESEVRQVYAIAMAYDNRKPSEANITAWWEQAIRNRWTLDEAREAVHEHHRNSADFLMPAHVTAVIRAGRRQPQPVSELRQLPASPPANPQRVGAILTELGRHLGWSRQHADPATLVECPYCHAQPKRPCTRLATRGPHRGEYIPLASFHASRNDLAGEAEDYPREVS